MKKLTVFLFLTFLFLCQAQAKTTTIEGLIVEKKGAKYIRLTRDSELLALVPNDETTRQHLSRLKEGDFLIGTAHITGHKRLRVTSVDFVGLKELLGRWVSGEWEVFDFLDFSNLIFYQSRSYVAPPKSPWGRNLRYTLAPAESKSHWSILIVDENSVVLGRLYSYHRRVTIDVVSPQTGQVIRSIELVPFSFHL